MRHLTNLPINYLIPINFLGFIGVVNKLGGVWLDVDRRYYNKNVGTSGTDFANINLQPGYQHLTGKQALDFVRFRHTDSDLYRLARQQLFVGAARQQVAKSLGLSTVLGIVNTVTQNHYMEVERGGRAVNLSDIKKYASFAYNLPHGHVFQVKIQNIFGQNELATDQSNIDDAVQQFLNPDVGEASTATAVALGHKLPARKRTIPPRQVTLTVLNGNGVAGSAGNASYLLGQKGYVAVTPAERPAGERAELELLPLEGLLRPRARGEREGRRAAGLQADRQRRRRAAAGAAPVARERGAADRDRRLDLPRRRSRPS